jgi:hypothetical protein
LPPTRRRFEREFSGFGEKEKKYLLFVAFNPSILGSSLTHFKWIGPVAIEIIRPSY